jgi:GntR family transcriptional regulator
MDVPLVRSPVYQQLHERLRDALAREFRRGQQFLTERAISDRFGVSRATANKALASLVSQGWLEFRKGLGTFVRRDAIDYDVRSLVSFTEKARAAGKSPSTTVLAFDRVPFAEVEIDTRTALGLADADDVWRLERLRLADGVPVILERRAIVYRACPGLTRKEVSGSLYAAWTGRHKLDIGGATTVIRAIALDRGDAVHLQVAARSPALEVVSTGFLVDGRALWRERTLYRGDRYEFHTRSGPIAETTPARGVLRGE